MPYSFKGKNVLVTGGGSGIGRLMCQEFARRGCTVIIYDIREGIMQETKDLIQKERSDASVHIYQCDLSKKENIYATSDKVLKEVGKVDMLVNNAGIVSGKRFLDCDDESIQRTMDVNAMAHMWLAKKFLPPMVERKNGFIITIASAAATCGVVGLADYCASKWAAMGFNESIRMELRQKGLTDVKTLCICPYYINTGMFDGITTKVPWLLPILDPTYVVNQIFYGIESDKGVVLLPKTLTFTYILRALLPTSWNDYLAERVGISSTMDSFRGRGTAWMKGTDVNNNNNTSNSNSNNNNNDSSSNSDDKKEQ